MSEKEENHSCEHCEALLDSIQAAELLRIDDKTLQRMACKREIPAIKVGRLWRFRGSELDTWVRSRFTPEKQRSR